MALTRRTVLSAGAVGVTAHLLPAAAASASPSGTSLTQATSVTASGDSGLRIDWDVVTGAATYAVSWRVSGGGAFSDTGVAVDTSDPAAPSATIVGLTNDVAHEVLITANAADGTSSQATVTATPVRVAPGGTVTGSGPDAVRTHTFTATPSGGTMTFAAPRVCDALVVGGGGGGGASFDTGSGGGGAGGQVVEQTVSVDAGTITVTVGTGGAGGAGNRTGSPNESPGAAGGASVFATVTAGPGRGGAASRFGGDPGLRLGGVAFDGETFLGQGGGGGGNAAAGIGSGGGAGAGGDGADGASTGTAAGGAGVTATLTGTTYGVGGSGPGRTRTSTAPRPRRTAVEVAGDPDPSASTTRTEAMEARGSSSCDIPRCPRPAAPEPSGSYPRSPSAHASTGSRPAWMGATRAWRDSRRPAPCSASRRADSQHMPGSGC
jgi:hypothetical protein